MPELPEVETVARDLARRVVGETIAGVRVSWERTLRNAAPETFAAAVTGRTIEAVGRRGKQLVVRLSGDRAVTIHLKMTGQLFVVPAGLAEDAYVRVVFEFESGRELRFRDIRKFGRIGVYERDPATGELREEGRDAFAKVGPEPLDEAFTAPAFAALLRARRGRLKPLLVDQGFVAGVGNIYADEALWAARLHPLRTAASVPAADARRLYRELRRILAEAVERRGSSIDDYTAPDGDGSMQERLLVYQRTGQPCLRCGRPIRRIVIGARSTHFCSWCQRLPKADREGARRILALMVPRPGRPAARRGPRWAELEAGAPATRALGQTGDEAAAARARAERTRAAAATRRAAARGEGALQSSERPGAAGASGAVASTLTDLTD